MPNIPILLKFPHWKKEETTKKKKREKLGMYFSIT